MRPLSLYAASILTIGMSMPLLAAQSVNYQDAQNVAQTMNVESTQFETHRPEICSEKKAEPAPAPVAAPEPVSDSDKDGVADAVDKCPDTPHGYKVDPTGCPVHVTLHAHFAFDSSVMPASSDGDVATLTRVMKENPQATAIIVGHTDWVGSDEYNQKLSERRANALGNRLKENGIEPDRIKTSGKGEKEPIATNATSEGRAQNRRIEVELQ